MEKDFNLATGLQTLFGENLREGVDNEAHLSIVTEESSGTRVDITIEDEGDMWAVKTETRIRGVSGISPGG